MISIITPTYNRRHTLKRLFDSLLAQSDPEFEWIIVDDGSTDGTSLYLKDLLEQASFPVAYIFQENAGKHVAVNRAMKECRGNLVGIVDSDDYLTPNAIEVINEKKRITPFSSGMCFRMSNIHGDLVGKSVSLAVPKEMTPTAAGSYFGGDLFYIFRYNTIVKYPFPVIPGEKFVPEQFIWNKISEEAPITYFPDVSIYRCEYQSDGYSANFKSNLKNNPLGFFLHYSDQIYREITLYKKAKCFIRSIQCIFYYYRKRSKKSSLKIKAEHLR